MRLLLINPNTSVHITDRLARSARAVMAADDTLTAVTATQGPTVVRNAEQLAEADAGTLLLAEQHLPGHDALLLGISLDGAVRTLRQRWPQALIVGMTEAALHLACLRADRIGLLTLGAGLLPLYRQRVADAGLAERVVAYQAPELPAAFAADDDVEATVVPPLAEAIEQLRADGARAVVLAGAVLCGYAPALQRRSGLPVFDGMQAAVLQAHALRALSSTAP